MKKLLFIAVLASALFSSCRKEYSCYCTNADGDIIDQMLYGRMIQKKAENQCNSMELVYSEMELQCTAKEI